MSSKSEGISFLDTGVVHKIRSRLAYSASSLSFSRIRSVQVQPSESAEADVRPPSSTSEESDVDEMALNSLRRLSLKALSGVAESQGVTLAEGETESLDGERARSVCQGRASLSSLLWLFSRIVF